jgi:anaerobic selenocysteine-containing dehydrogenase
MYFRKVQLYGFENIIGNEWTIWPPQAVNIHNEVIERKGINEGDNVEVNGREGRFRGRTSNNREKE